MIKPRSRKGRKNVYVYNMKLTNGTVREYRSRDAMKIRGRRRISKSEEKKGKRK